MDLSHEKTCGIRGAYFYRPAALHVSIPTALPPLNRYCSNKWLVLVVAYMPNISACDRPVPCMDKLWQFLSRSRDNPYSGVVLAAVCPLRPL